MRDERRKLLGLRKKGGTQGKRREGRWCLLSVCMIIYLCCRVWLVYGYGTVAVFVISVSSLIGLLIVSLRHKPAYIYVINTMLGLGVGTLVGDAMLHLIPHVCMWAPAITWRTCVTHWHCVFRIDVRPHHATPDSCTGWRCRSASSLSWLFSCTNAYTRQLRRTLLRNSISHLLTRLVSVSALRQHHPLSSDAPVFQPSAIELFQSLLPDCGTLCHWTLRRRRQYLFSGNIWRPISSVILSLNLL